MNEHTCLLRSATPMATIQTVAGRAAGRAHPTWAVFRLRPGLCQMPDARCQMLDGHRTMAEPGWSFWWKHGEPIVMDGPYPACFPSTTDPCRLNVVIGHLSVPEDVPLIRQLYGASLPSCQAGASSATVRHLIHGPGLRGRSPRPAIVGGDQQSISAAPAPAELAQPHPGVRGACGRARAHDAADPLRPFHDGVA